MASVRIKNLHKHGLRSQWTEIVGIDTGVNTGIAFWDFKRKVFVALRTVKIHQAMREVFNQLPAFVRVEDARLMTLPRKFQKHNDPKMLQNIGSVKRDAKIWEEFLTDCGIPFELVSPKANVRKLTAAAFKQRTGFEDRTNEHMRDAGMLVFGVESAQVKRWIQIYG